MNPPLPPLPTPAIDREAIAAPPNSLPPWDECRLRVANSDYIAERVASGGYGAEPDSLTASALHRFIYEYDDANPIRSTWFLHRLEAVVNEAKAAPLASPVEGEAVGKPVVSVAGDVMLTSIAQHVRRCSLLLADEQEKIAPDNALIACLCDSIRLTREHVNLATGRITSPSPSRLAAACSLLSEAGRCVRHHDNAGLADRIEAFVKENAS